MVAQIPKTLTWISFDFKLKRVYHNSKQEYIPLCDTSIAPDLLKPEGTPMRAFLLPYLK